MSGLLIDRPLELVDQLFGPDQRLDGYWAQPHQLGAPIYVAYDADEDAEEDDGALEIEGELCS